MRSFVTNLSLVLISTIMTLLVCEAGYRLWSGVPVFRQPEFLQSAESHREIGCGNEFDPELGWKPAPLREGVNSSGRQVSILPTGIRSNGQEDPSGSPVVLAVGDSYTFGDHVNDEQSWPAALERDLSTTVFNGGVCGYGIGQSVRRAEILLPRFEPDILIVGMIPTDIDRTRAVKFYGRSKPYFELSGGQLVYRTEHLSGSLGSVLSQPDDSKEERSLIQSVNEALRDHSLLWRSLAGMRSVVDQIVSRIALIRGAAHTYVTPDGVDLSCQLLRRVKSFEQEFDLKAFLLVQYKFRDILNRMKLDEGQASGSENRDMEVVADTIELVGCAEEIGIHTIDTFAPLREIYIRYGRLELAGLYSDHMSPKGNQFVADLIAKELSEGLVISDDLE